MSENECKIAMLIRKLSQPPRQEPTVTGGKLDKWRKTQATGNISEPRDAASHSLQDAGSDNAAKSAGISSKSLPIRVQECLDRNQ